MVLRMEECMIDLIYTSGNNRAYAQLSQDAGWLVGMRSDKTPCYDPIQFVDCDYDVVDFASHLEMVKQLHPHYATVPDLSEIEVSRADVDRALRQYDQLAQYCAVPLIVPKLAAQLALLPAHVAIGFSVVSRYGGVQSLEFEILPLLQGRHVHLLGGSPHKQLEMYRYISCYASVISVDGNMLQYMSGFAKYWYKGKWIKHPRKGENDSFVSQECIARSLKNIKEAWMDI